MLGFLRRDRGSDLPEIVIIYMYGARAMYRWAVASVALFCAAVFSAHAATITESVWKDGKTRISLEGEISLGDSDKLKSIVKSVNESGRTVHGIRLNSMGGNLLEGVALADLVQFAKILTTVPPGAKCASACFIVFAAGNEKYASHSASVGVHGASDESGRETIVSGAATVSMARIVKGLGVPPHIIGKMVATPPDQIVWLTPDELRTMNVTMTGKPDQLRPDQQLQTQLPMQITPQTRDTSSQTQGIGSQAQAAAPPPSWGELVKGAEKISSAQNNGRPHYVRNCQPELKVCNTALFFKGKDDKSLMLKVTENLSGKIILREFCSFNDFRDVRTCFDWDTNALRRDMKDRNGKWSQVSDE